MMRTELEMFFSFWRPHYLSLSGSLRGTNRADLTDNSCSMNSQIGKYLLQNDPMMKKDKNIKATRSLGALTQVNTIKQANTITWDDAITQVNTITQIMP